MNISYYEDNWPVWDEPYEKPVGKEYVFHVNVRDEIHIVQNDEYDRYVFTAVDLDAVRALAKIVNKCKEYYTGSKGGSFCINEFGQVIVPLSPLRDQYGNIIEWRDPRYVADIEGDIFFFNGKENITMNPDPPLQCGDPWPYPYLGMKYRLATGNKIYKKCQDGDDTFIIYLEKNNEFLIKQLRKIRPSSGISFLVNPWGCVLTKKQDRFGEWKPYFVGMLDYRNWFDKPYDD